MSRRSNFNDAPDDEHRFGNFGRRLNECLHSELEPEQATPNTAGAEELPEYEEIFPLTRQFRQTNFHGTNSGRRGSDDQRQSKDRRRRSEEKKGGSLG